MRVNKSIKPIPEPIVWATPLILTGTMRSGTTLMSDLLYSSFDGMRHPQIIFSDDSNTLLRKVSSEIIALPENKHKAYRPDELLDLTTFPFHCTTLERTFFTTEGFHRSWLSRLYSTLASEIDDNGQMTSVYGIKTTNTLKFYRFLRKSLPYSKCLVMLRDPRDVFASHTMRVFERGYRSTYRIILDMLVLYIELTNTWLNLQGSTLVVRYEDLVSTPEKILSEVFFFLRLQLSLFDYKMLDTSGFINNSAYSQPDKPGAKLTHCKISNASIGRYKDYLSPSDIQMIDAVFAPFMKMMGYLPSNRGENSGELISASVHRLIKLAMELEADQAVIRHLSCIL